MEDLLKNEEKKEIPREYVEMAYVKETATGRGHNEFFIMENLKNGSMKITTGRVGITIGRYKPTSQIFPIEDWDNVYAAKIRKGYMPIKTKKMDKIEVTKRNGGVQDDSFAEIPDAKTQAFVNGLLAFAKHNSHIPSRLMTFQMK